MNTTWKTVPQRYGSDVDFLLVGKIRVGEVGYASGSKGDPTAYSFKCYLPGLKSDATYGKCPTEDEAKAALLMLVKKWVRYAGLEGGAA